MTFGAATQICSHRYDKRLFSLPVSVQQQIAAKVDQLGLRLTSFPHVRMQGVEAFRLRIGDYRVIYTFDAERNEMFLITVGHRKDIYHEVAN